MNTFEIDECLFNYNDLLFAGLYTDITLSEDGFQYSFVRKPIISETGIYSHNAWLTPTFYSSVFGDTTIEGITTTPEDIIWMVATSQTAYTLNLWTGQISQEGNLPDNMNVAGGVTHRQGDILYSTLENQLVKLDKSNPENSSILFTFPENTPPIHAMTTIHTTCSDLTTYAVGLQPFSSILYEVDFENETLIEVCEYDRTVYGLTHELENIIPPCEVYVDLNPSPIAQNYSADTICTPPLHVTDEYVEVYSELGYIDSLRISISGGLFNTNEYIALETSPLNVNVTGSGTTEILLTKTETSTEVDFADALKEIVYHNDTPQIFYGLRIISFTAYSSVYSNSETRTFIPISNEILIFNPEINSPLCAGEDNGSITVAPSGGLAPYTLLWQDGTSLPTLSNLPPATYNVTLTDGEGCIKWGDFTVEDAVPLSVEIINAGPMAVCDTFGILTVNASGGAMPYSFLWSNGKTEMTATGFDDATHEVTITDANECTITTSFTLEESENFQTDVQEIICQGEIYAIGEYNLTNDTSLCVPFLSIAGCDSLVCLDLIVNDTFYMEENLLLCLGEDYEIEGVTYDSDTTVCVIYQSINNCDSTVCTTLSFQGFTEFLNAEICAGEEFPFGSQTLTITGEYENVLMDINGCDSIQNLNLVVFANPIPQIVTEGSICAEGEVELSTSQIYSEYLWSTGNTSSNLSIQSSGIFELMVTDENGCIGISEVTINEDAIQISTINTTPSCFDLSDGIIEIENISGGTEPYLYSLNNAPLTNTLSFQNLPAGTYQLLTEDAEGCQNTTEITLEQPQAIGLFLEEEVLLNLGDSLEMRPFSNTTVFDSISWTPTEFVSCDTCLQTYLQPVETTRYVLEVVDEFGCTDEAVIIAVVDRNTKIFAPTAISPNFDGINDIFYLQSKENLIINQFEIFDRWGNLIHSVKGGITNDAELGWDGFDNGQKVQDGVYVWVAEVVLSDGTFISIGGDVGVF